MPKQLTISADSHVVEPMEVYAPVARRFGGETKMVETPDRGLLLDTGLGRTVNVGLFATAGMEPQSPIHDATERAGYAARESLTNIKARLKDMDADGVDAEVLYPSNLGPFFGMQEEDLEVSKATLASYNDWLANYVQDSEGRMFALAAIQTKDIEAAVAEIERAKALGHVGLVLPAAVSEERPYIDPAYEYIWATAQELGMPITFHSGVTAAPGGGLPSSFRRHGLGYTLIHVGMAVVISDIIMSGVCERYPRLRFVATEFETGWIAHFLQRMDWRQYRRGDRTALPLNFSDYWHRNFLCTFEDDEIGVRTREIIGVDSMMWASDYPHGDSVWPNSQAVIERTMKDCTPDERYAMTAKTVVELYDLPFEV
jgi:predicted TIM-barrel fold metal-dependent hydrolase